MPEMKDLTIPELIDQIALAATGGIDDILKEGKVPVVIVYLDELRRRLTPTGDVAKLLDTVIADFKKGLDFPAQETGVHHGLRVASEYLESGKLRTEIAILQEDAGLQKARATDALAKVDRQKEVLAKEAQRVKGYVSNQKRIQSSESKAWKLIEKAEWWCPERDEMQNIHCNCGNPDCPAEQASAALEGRS